MKLRRLLGICLIGIGSLCCGYFLGVELNSYLPDVLLLKVLIFLAILGSGIYLMVRNKQYISGVL